VQVALFVAALIVGDGVGADPVAPPAASVPPLASVEADFKAGVRARCVSLAKDALRSGRLEPLEYATAWLVRGRCHVLQEDIDKAERSYAVAVRVQKDIALPTEDAVLARVKAAAVPLTLRARAIPDASGRGVVVEATLVDDLAIGDHLEVRVASNATPLAIGAASGPTTLAGRSERFTVVAEGAEVVLVDKYGNRVARAPVTFDDEANAALTAAGAAPQVVTAAPRHVTALAYVGGATIVASFITAAVCGINHTVVAQADESRVLDEELPWLVGFGAGAVGVVVGMGLVAVERLTNEQPAPAPAVPDATSSSTEGPTSTASEPAPPTAAGDSVPP